MLDAIEQLLKTEIGLDTRTVGPSIIRHAVKKRMAACKLTDMQLYWDLLLHGSRTEMQELIDATIVPETWFFRDREAFAAMVRHARTIQNTVDRPVRILSIPCSTGEEPYSAAMALLDAGFSEQDFLIDAIDISARNLVDAERAIYGRNSFRGSDLSFRDRYFEAVENEFRPRAPVRNRVRFKLGNVLDPRSVPASEIYDVVFCRNLLIYFDRDTQQQALIRLNGLLSQGGVLFVGPAESGLPTMHGFTSARQSMAFAFTKAHLVAPPPIPLRPPHRVKAVPPAPPRAPAPKRTPPKPAPARPVESQADRAADSLVAIEQAANAGRITEARDAAMAHVKTFGPSSQAFYLLGLVHDADNAPTAAVASYRKALYLEPDHREAIAHLALILRDQGDLVGARALSSRLERIDKRSGA